MRQETRTSYRIGELSEEAREKAVEHYRNNGAEWHWHDEARDTLEAFCNMVGVKVLEYDIERADVRIAGHDDVEIKGLTGARLMSYLYNRYYSTLYKPEYVNVKRRKSCVNTCDCPLTGYCMDYDILKPLLDAMSGRRYRDTYWDIVNDCLQSWAIAARKDYEYSLSDEYIIDHLQTNEAEYDINGNPI